MPLTFAFYNLYKFQTKVRKCLGMKFRITPLPKNMIDIMLDMGFNMIIAVLCLG